MQFAEIICMDNACMNNDKYAWILNKKDKRIKILNKISSRSKRTG